MNKKLLGDQSFLSVSAPAKINLHLEVLGLRADGFHELAMVMQSIDLVDHLRIKNTGDGLLRLSSDKAGLSNGPDNLIIKAAELLQSRSGINELGADIYLQKNIPIGAGLAGGSSNGAAALVGLNHLWGLNFSQKELEIFAAELGSDMPFCLAGGTQLCFGRGDNLEPLATSNKSKAVLLLKDPLTSVSTPWAYKHYKELRKDTYLHSEDQFEIRRKKLRDQNWLYEFNEINPPPLHNDLEQIVAPVTPAVEKAINILRELSDPPLAVAMSGSGPSCFALYSDHENALLDLESSRNIFENEGFQTWCCPLRFTGVMFHS